MLIRDADIGKCDNNESSVYLEPAGQKLILDLQEVPSAHLPFERLIEDGKPHVVLHILPPSVTVSETLGLSLTTWFHVGLFFLLSSGAGQMLHAVCVFIH